MSFFLIGLRGIKTGKVVIIAMAKVGLEPVRKAAKKHGEFFTIVSPWGQPFLHGTSILPAFSSPFPVISVSIVPISLSIFSPPLAHFCPHFLISPFIFLSFLLIVFWLASSCMLVTPMQCRQYMFFFYMCAWIRTQRAFVAWRHSVK
jgi:hypothetical protein